MPAPPAAEPIAAPTPTGARVASAAPVAPDSAPRVPAAPDAAPSPRARDDEPRVAVVAPPAPLEPPLLRPVRTTWHPSAERRSARLESPAGAAREVREGDEVEGYEVVEITPSSVVFALGGDTVRVRVGAR